MGGHLRCSQEPRSKEGSDYFDSRSDGLNVDTQGPSQGSVSLWSGGSTQILSHRSESAHAIGSDPLQQNIYENFMRELEMSRTNTENLETSTETAESSSESPCSLRRSKGWCAKPGGSSSNPSSLCRRKGSWNWWPGGNGSSIG